MPLTDAKVRNLKPTERPQRFFDGDGLYLEVRPNGAKWWRFKYRFDGKEKLLSFGTYPEVPLALARARRLEARQQVAAGINPSAVRKEAKEAKQRALANTLEKVARAWLARRASAWTEGTRDAIEASLENHVFPALGNRSIHEISTRDIRTVVQAIDEQGSGETAGRVFQRLRSVFRYALSEELADSDPTLPLKPSEIFKPRVTSHRPSLAEVDMPAFFRKLDAYEGDPCIKAAFELLLLTAVRPGELRGARWSEMDESQSLWRIPAERMKMATEHLVPLSNQALAVLQRMKAVSGGQGLMFPSTFYPGKPLSDGTLNSVLARFGYKGMATAHGFRTLFSTCANEAGWDSDVIEKQLSHEERDDVRGAYNRAQWLPERIELMQWWADRLDSLRTGPGTRVASKRVAARNSVARLGSFVRDESRASGRINSESRQLNPPSMPAPVAKNALPNPIEVLRALVAAFDQHSPRVSKT
ncbi:MAG: tyrosine-type recombinase/integrase [Burkholderiales bacterium]|nr:tyrosine-type recombinase/integrase [Burkholderiales bacterium]